MMKSNMDKFLAIVIVLIILSVGLYIYGSHIPLINKIPIFDDVNEHEYTPVLNEKGEIDYWTCVMHPSVRMKDPGQCPICSMDTVAVMKKDNSQTNPDSQTKLENTNKTTDTDSMAGMHEHDHNAMGVRTKPGYSQDTDSTFWVAPERQQLIGIKTEPARMRTMDKEIRTVGMVELDESRIYNIQTRYSGWIEKVFVDYRWQHVHIGQPLFTIYSPDLVTAQEEYLLALKSKNILNDSQFADISRGANSLLKASRRRLELLGVTRSQIQELERTGEVRTNLIVYSPVKGHVAQKNAFENMRVEPNTLLYKIADHTTAWVQVDIYENEIALIKLGDKATMTLASFPGEVFEGEVKFINPHITPETRTVKVRLEFPNPDLKLLPEMYADVTLDIPVGERLTIPTSAVLKTGKNDIVFVDKGEGNMEIRKVELGQKAGSYYEVLRGLKDGDEVVSRANFLIDSESKVQAAVATWGEYENEQEVIENINPQPEKEQDNNTNRQQLK